MIEFVAALVELNFFTDFGTVYAFMALIPIALVWKAFKMADEWMINGIIQMQIDKKFFTNFVSQRIHDWNSFLNRNSLGCSLHTVID